MSGFFEDEPPPNLTPWEEAGIRRGHARQWVRWRFTLREALRWRAVGVDQAVTAAQWRTSGVTPSTVGDWRSAGIGPTAAVRWHEFGIGLDDASRLTAAGHGPDSPEAWELKRPDTLRHDDEALVWARHGISADDARLWLMLGLHPHEAAAVDLTPTEAITAWWRSGIPFDEVADWIGAGFSAEEAMERRDAGMDADEAAARRARRSPGD